MEALAIRDDMGDKTALVGANTLQLIDFSSLPEVVSVVIILRASTRRLRDGSASKRINEQTQYRHSSEICMTFCRGGGGAGDPDSGAAAHP